MSKEQRYNEATYIWQICTFTESLLHHVKLLLNLGNPVTVPLPLNAVRPQPIVTATTKTEQQPLRVEQRKAEDSPPPREHKQETKTTRKVNAESISNAAETWCTGKTMWMVLCYRGKNPQPVNTADDRMAKWTSNPRQPWMYNLV